MISFNWAALRVAARHGWFEYRIGFSFPVLVGLMLPRIIFQVAFLAFIGGLGAPDGRRDAFIGSSLLVMALGATVYAGLGVAQERNDNTGVQLILGGVPASLVRIAHSWAYIVQGLVFSVTGILVVGPILGYWELSLRLVCLLPLYSVAGIGMLGLGLTVATLSPQGLEIVVLNVANSILLVLSGAVFPLANLGVLAGPAHLLPSVNTLLAVRSALDGESWIRMAIAEGLVGALWLALAILGSRLIEIRIRQGANGRAGGG